MNGAKRVTKVLGRLLLSLLCGALVPVLIWVALGAAIAWRLRGRKGTQTAADRIGEILASVQR